MRTLKLVAAAATAMISVLAHSNAMAAVENYSVTEGYTINGQPGQVTVSFSLDPSSPDYSNSYSDPSYGYGSSASWTPTAVSFIYSGASLGISDANNYASYYQTSWMDYYYGASKNAGLSFSSSEGASYKGLNIDLNPRFSDTAKVALIGAQEAGRGYSAYYAYNDNTYEYSSGTLSGVTPVQAIAPVPEPETYAMMIAGLGVLGFMGRSRKAKTT